MRMAGKSIMFSAMYIMIIINILIFNILHFHVVHLFFIVMTYKLHIFAIGKQNTTRPIMKKSLLIIIASTALSSCCTVFTASKQNVTFMAPNGTKIYDVETNVKIAEVEKDNMVTTKIKKKISDKQLVARKEGYSPTPFILETEFNVSSLWNFLFWPGFLVDLGTGKMFKWDNTIINLELEPETGTNE